MAGLDDEEFARADAAQAEEEWGPEFERRAEHDATELRDRPLIMFGIWPETGDDPLPAQVCLTDDGDEVSHQIDATPLLEQALRRQAREWCRSVEDSEGPALEQLLAIARHHRLDLIVTHDAAGSCEAGWWSDDAPKKAVASAKAPGLTAAIRAATIELLGVDVPVGGRQLSGSPARLIHAAIDYANCYHHGLSELGPARGELLEAVEELRAGTASGTASACAACQVSECQHAGEQLSCPDCGQLQPWCCVGQTERPLCLCTPTPVEEPRQTCGSCEHWRRDDEPATEAGARPCGLDEEHNPAPRHPQSSCGFPGFYRALGTAKTDPAPESGSSYPSSDEALAAKIAELQTVVATGDSHFPGATRRYLDELLAEQRRRRLGSPPLKGVSRPADNVIQSRGDDDV